VTSTLHARRGFPALSPHTRARDRVAGEYRCEEIDSCQILGTATTCQVCQLLSALTIRQSEMQCLCAFSLRSGEPHMGIKSWDPCCWRISGHVGRPSSE